MAKITSRRQLPIWECQTEDGGTGIKIGESGSVFMGVDERDLMRLLRAIFPEDTGRRLDGDLLAIAEVYLDEDRAHERMAEIEAW